MQFELRTSERATFKRCPARWNWSYLENLVSIRSKPALWFGTAVHEALAAWYLEGTKRGPHPAETIATVLDGMRKIVVYDEEDEAKYVDACLLGEQMMNRYVEFYGTDPSWEVIATEQTFQVWIPHPDGTNTRWIRYVGTADGVFRDLETDEIFLMEHKTAAAIRTDHLPLDDQAGSYWAVMNSKLRRMDILGPKESIAGIRYNFLRKALDDDRPKNAEGLATNKPQKKHYIEALQAIGVTHIAGGTGSVAIEKAKLEDLETACSWGQIPVLGDVSDRQPPPYFERVDVYRSQNQRRTMIKRIQDEGRHMEAMRTGLLPIYKVPTKDCSWCEFFRLCQMDEEGSEFFEDFKEAEFVTRDPYGDHRLKKSAEA
jgi:hypothetical protein